MSSVSLRIFDSVRNYILNLLLLLEKGSPPYRYISLNKSGITLTFLLYNAMMVYSIICRAVCIKQKIPSSNFNNNLNINKHNRTKHSMLNVISESTVYIHEEI